MMIQACKRGGEEFFTTDRSIGRGGNGLKLKEFKSGDTRLNSST